nr:MAG TPA: hypothetical protein [Bacteriophage sp.]
MIERRMLRSSLSQASAIFAGESPLTNRICRNALYRLLIRSFLFVKTD